MVAYRNPQKVLITDGFGKLPRQGISRGEPQPPSGVISFLGKLLTEQSVHVMLHVDERLQILCVIAILCVAIYY